MSEAEVTRMMGETDPNEDSPVKFSESEFVKFRQKIIDAAMDMPDSVNALFCKSPNHLMEFAVNVLRFSPEVVGQAIVQSLARKGKWEVHADVVQYMTPFFLD